MQSLEVSAIHNQINEILTSLRENPHVNTGCGEISVVGMGSMLNLSVKMKCVGVCAQSTCLYMC